MAQGIKAFRKAQYGIEGTRGVKATINHIAQGTMSFNPEVKVFEPDDDLYRLSRYNRRTIVEQSTPVSWEGPLTFEQAIALLAMALKGGVTAVAGVEGFKWMYTPSLTAVNAPNSISIEAGDNAQVFTILYVMCKSLELNFAMNDVWKFRADMVGRPMAAGGSFTVLTPDTVYDMLGSKTNLYLNPSWATLGNTVVSSTLVSGSIKLNTGFVPVTHGGSNLYFSSFSETKRNLEVDLTCIFNSSMVSEYASFIAGTPRFIRVETLGPVIVTTTPRRLSVDLCGVIQSWDKIGERDGEDVVNLKIVSQYDQTSGYEFQAEAANALNAV